MRLKSTWTNVKFTSRRLENKEQKRNLNLWGLNNFFLNNMKNKK